MRLLLVEDNVALADELVPLLQHHGYAVDWLVDGRDAAVQASDNCYDIIVLDLGLPGRDGIEILQEWRALKLTIAVLVLTARDTWADRIDGLKAGADDYLTKPFHPEELVLRIQALVRRTHSMTNQPMLEVGGLQLDEDRHCVISGTSRIQLTGSEFQLLRYFMLHAGKLLSRSHLAEHLYDNERERDSNVIEVHINRLRGKLGRSVIETRRGQGYLFRGVSA
ncbi:Transcriptional regulatory protein QseB [Halioglobus japonicus]|nr:Transcriptional regulatory protein QseB [Halioglobus japonicus]